MSNPKFAEKLQRFGSAMFVSVMLFPFVGILLAVIMIFKNPMLVGGVIANPDGFFYQLLVVMEEGAWTVFRYMPLLFAVGIPISLATKAPARAVMATLVTFLTWNFFINAILSQWGANFGVDFSQEPGGVSGLTMLAGIKTLDTSIVGGILIGFVVTAIHNRFYDKKLPDYLGIFQGLAFVAMVGFFVMLPLALVTVMVWPVVQSGIAGLQGFLKSSGVVGVWLYTFLERMLIPTGLHHFIYGPFIFGPAVIEGGIQQAWTSNINNFAASTLPLSQLFPEGAFSLHGNSKIFGLPAVAFAMYFTAKPENRPKLIGLLVPAALTAFLTGITEPLEFTFLFLAPMLFAVHAFLGATLSAILFLVGVRGNMGAGAIEVLASFWLPMFKNHTATVLLHIGIGLIFSAIYFLVFRFLILRYDLPTPGRGNSEAKLYTKQDFKAKQALDGGATSGGAATTSNAFTGRAVDFLHLLGGKENIVTVNNCMTRLRIQVKDGALVQESAAFMEAGASGLVKKGEAVQVIVGLDVPNVRDEFEKLL